MSSVPLSSEIHPALTEYVVKLLHKHRIVSVLDLAKTDVDRLARISNLPFDEVSTIKADLIGRFSGSSMPAIQLMPFLGELVEPITTGIRGLDLLLEGGLLAGLVTEIYGKSSSGKTQLTTSIAMNVARLHKYDVLYIDTKCDFSVQRLHGMLEHSKCSNTESREIMGRIKIERIFSPEDLICALEELVIQIDSLGKLKLIIIDSLPSLWYLHQNSKSNCYPLGMLTRFVGLLRKLASDNLLSVITVNIEISSSDTFAQSSSRKLSNQRTTTQAYCALGRFWESAPTTRLLISKIEYNDTGQERLLTIKKCNYLNSGDRQIVTITEAGVV